MELGALTFLVPSYDEGIAFFTGPLGFELIEDIDQGRKRWVKVASHTGPAFILAEPTTKAQRAALGAQTGDRVGFFLHSDDFAADHTRMIAAGVMFEEEPRQEPYGTVAVFRDPWGNRWDLIEPKA